MIKIAPIIHSRTYKCDFNPNIIVHPENLNIEWARNKIVSATSSINNMEHGTVRWVIARESNKSIAGIVCYIKDLIKFCNKEEKTISKLCYDNKGRSIFAFIGISFQSYEEKVNLNFDYEYFLDIYIKYMLNIWENENPISIISTYNDYSGKIFDNDFDDINFQKQKKKIGTLECYKMGIETDKKLFDYYLSKLFTNDELTFCSNLDIKKIREGNFDIVSTNENTIIRLENAEKNNLNLEENYFNNTNIDNLERKKEISTVEKKKEILRQIFEYICFYYSNIDIDFNKYKIKKLSKNEMFFLDDFLWKESKKNKYITAILYYKRNNQCLNEYESRSFEKIEDFYKSIKDIIKNKQQNYQECEVKFTEYDKNLSLCIINFII